MSNVWALRGRRILLISPQPWGHLAISKHHYARELAARGNEVLFLEPPSASGPHGLTRTKAPDAPEITLLRYRLWQGELLKYRWRSAFDMLMELEIVRLRKALGNDLDVVWSFDQSFYSDLRRFEARLTIFHPVDAVYAPHHIAAARHADLVLSVSRPALDAAQGIARQTRFVNHGLSRPFANVARRPMEVREPGPPRIGYVGNLLHPVVDHDVIIEMIRRNPAVTFHFWGPCSPAQPGSAGDRFVRRLRDAANAVLHGRVETEQLAATIPQMDAFILAYAPGHAVYDSSNSHKVLEYLSTGKAVISSRLTAYEDRPDLLIMPEERSNASLPGLLEEVLAHLPIHNSTERAESRRAYALDQTYGAQLDRIEGFISEALQQSRPAGRERPIHALVP